jgi:hypothetical protein
LGFEGELTGNRLLVQVNLVLLQRPVLLNKTGETFAFLHGTNDFAFIRNKSCTKDGQINHPQRTVKPLKDKAGVVP